jgi:hypothetical protein
MSVMSALDQAHEGLLFRKLGELAGLAPSDARKVLDAVCPSIAARLKNKAGDPAAYEELLDLLDDNEGDLITGGDLASAEVAEDGRAVLAEIYGSEERARAEALASARALRIDTGAVEFLYPIAAALVLSILSRRYRNEKEEEKDEPVSQASAQTGGRDRPGILGLLLAAIGGAILRALVNRLMPRRRRRRPGYGRLRPRRRRTRRREPRIEDLFRDLVG